LLIEAERIDQEATNVLVLWPKLNPRYLVTVGLQDTGDEFECASFKVTTLQEGTPVGSVLMRSLPVGALIGEAIQKLLRNALANTTQQITERPDLTVHDGDGNSIEGAALGVEREDFFRNRDAHLKARQRKLKSMLAAATGQGTGRRYPPGHLEVVAEIVRDARKAHEPISTAVADAFGITTSAAGNLIGRARAQGLLDTKSKGGKR